MNGWVLAGLIGVALFTVLFAWSACKVASDADAEAEFDAELRALIESSRRG